MSGSLTRLAFGRVGKPGDLYGCVEDSLCGGNAIEWEPLGSAKVTPMSVTRCVVADARTFFQRADALRMANEQQLSCFCQKKSFEGFWKILSDEQFEDYKSIVGLFYETISEEESENVLRCELSMEKIVEYDRATHIISKVQRGCRAAILVCLDSENQDVVAKAKESLHIVKEYLEQPNTDDVTIPELGYPIVFFSDGIPSGLKSPATLQECVDLISKLQSFLKSGDGGLEAVPVNFKLIPIALLQSLFGIQSTMSFCPVELQSFIKWKNFIEGILEAKKKLLVSHKKVFAAVRLFPDNVLNTLEEVKVDIERRFRLEIDQIWEIVMLIRKGEKESSTLGDRFCENTLVSVSAEEITEFVDSFEDVAKKPGIIKRLMDNRVIVVASEDFLAEVLGEAFAFFCSAAFPDDDFAAGLKIFEELPRGVVRVLVDLDLAKTSEHIPSSVRFYKDGVAIEKDVIGLRGFLQKGYNFVKYDGEVADEERPIHRVALQMKCPKCPKTSTDASCSSELKYWSCYNCKTNIEHGSDGFLYCECGQFPTKPANSLSFFCNDPRHGYEFAAIDEATMDEALKAIPKCKEYNILLIGETGSGKSTLINALVNYVSAETLEEAEGRTLRYFIPSSFTMEDDRRQVRTVVVGELENDNENFTAGESATQNPRSYTFNFGNQLIRLIDVPGMGDVRGAIKDRENFDKILRFLQQVTELHTICILLSPNCSRLTVSLKYCLNELLAHLHSNAKSNIVFGFTKTRTTFYRAGESLKTLKVYLERQNIDIPIVDDTMYYFDNEAFRLLCAERNGIKFSDDERKSYSQSWKKSSSETIRLLQYTIAAVPHRTREMISLNEIRRVIEFLTPSLADASTNIRTNIRLIEAKEVESRVLVAQGEDLSSRLYITQTTLEQVEIDYPQTVCASAKCVTTSTIPGATSETQRHYKQVCHDKCYLKGVANETYPDVRIMDCEAMDPFTYGTNMKCLQCGCLWNVHMHIYYVQEQKAEKIEDSTTKELLGANTDKQNILASHLRTLNKEKTRWEEAHKKITKYCAYFGAFLKANSIVAYNDAMIEYIDYSIGIARQDDSASGSNDNSRVKSLEKFKKEYEEELKVLRDASHGGRVVTLAEVLEMKDELFRMDIGVDFARILELRTRMHDAEANFVMREIHQDIPRTTLRRFEQNSTPRGARPSATSAASENPTVYLEELGEHNSTFWTTPSSGTATPSTSADFR